MDVYKYLELLTYKTTDFRGMSAREQKIYLKLFQNINVKH